MPVTPYGFPPHGIDGKRPTSNGSQTRTPVDDNGRGDGDTQSADSVRLGAQANHALTQRASASAGSGDVDAHGIANRLRAALSQSGESIASRSVDEVLSLFGATPEAAG